MEYSLKEIDYKNAKFQELCQKLDDFQNEIYPERTKLGLSALDGLEKLERIFALFDGDNIIACGGIKPVDNNTAELARMFTDINYRGQGLAKIIIKQVLNYAKTKGYKKIILDTWKKSTSARKLYNSLGFVERPPFDENAFKNSFATENNDIQKKIQDNLVFMELDL